MSDGAHLGISAEEAMKAAIGGVEPTTVETVGEMRDRILSTTIDEATSYDGTATYMAKIIIEAFMADPALAQVPTENVYEEDANGRLVFNAAGGLTLVTDGLWTVLKARMSPADLAAVEGMTGFMWGWAVNAARRCVELPPVPNPAIITIGSSR